MDQTEMEMDSTLKVLKSMAKRPEINIEFKNLTYTVRSGFGLSKKKTILHEISGTFYTGELTAIVGPSGSGKTSLMNILSDYSSIGVTGTIDINGRHRNKSIFNKLSCYIMQDDLIQEGLTVQESMVIVADLKLGSELRPNEKLSAINEILTTLGLIKCKDTRVERLSGGERKRLSIALELVNNPPVLFLDEPTSGLDACSTKQLITLLKCLAHSGRTIICTIHQPSTSILMLFDNVYFLDKGKCVYQGDPQMMVSYMERLNIHCPLTHNPADFILELLQSDDEYLETFSRSIRNGERSEFSNEMEDVKNEKLKRLAIIKIEDVLPKSITMDTSTGFCTQFFIITKRMLIQKRRNLFFLWTLLFHHIVSGVFVGILFYNVGNDGSNLTSSFQANMCISVFFLYTYVMTPILLFPLEFPLIKREHFNRWYGVPAYYTAMNLTNLPMIIVLGMVFLVITYAMTGYPLESDRIVMYAFTNLLVAFCSEGFGMTVGTLFSAQTGAIIGPCGFTPLLAVSGYGLGYGPYIEIYTPIKILMRISFLRYAVVAMSVAVYADREKLDCPDFYCHYSSPKTLLRDLGMDNTTYPFETSCLLALAILYKLTAYFSLHFRLREEFKDRIQRCFLTLLGRK